MTKNILLTLLLLVLCETIIMGSTTAWASNGNDQLLGALEQASGSPVRGDYHPRTGKLRFLKLENGAAMPHKGALIKPEATPEAAALGFMKEYGTLFGITTPDEGLKVRRKTSNAAGHSFVRFQQVHQGIPVFGGELVVQTGRLNGVLSVSGKAVPHLQMEVVPTITAEAAKEAALALVGKHWRKERAVLRASDPELTIYNPIILGPGLDTNSLVWRLEVSATDLSPIRELVLVDAKRGFIALHFNQAPHAKTRSIYDFYNQRENATTLLLPGTLVRGEGGSPSATVPDVNYAYDYAGDTYDFYLNTHGRDSIDNAGLPLISTVRYCSSGTNDSCPYQNAFWNGSQMVYGDGFTTSKDVVAHELTHGVTEKESGLFYYMQSGAINESLSDVWGEFVDQTYSPFPSPANRWIMGDALPQTIGPIRSMKDPTLFQNPDKMSSSYYICADGNYGSSDMGGVHYNSGINNKAAYLMTDGGSFNGKTVTGLGITKVAKIYYEAQTNLLVSASEYGDLYNLLQQACGNLTTTGVTTAADCIQVKNALDAVEMSAQPANCAAPEAPLCSSGNPVNVYYDTFESQGGWSVQAPTGTQSWSYITQPYATSGITSFWGQDLPTANNSIGFTSVDTVIPANAFLYFRHAYDFEFSSGGTEHYDGGTVEYSTDGGSSWSDAGALGSVNGYNGAITTTSDNPLGGRNAFVGLSNGYTSTRIDLSSLAGQSVRIGFRVGSDTYGSSLGWLIDDVRIYTCAAPDGTPPAITARNPASGATNVSVSALPAVTFSEDMDPATISSATYTLGSGSVPVSGNVTYLNRIATFTPGGASTLAPGRTYTATITSAVTDLASNHLAADNTWSFTTGMSGSCSVRMDGGLCFPAIGNAYDVAVLNSTIQVTSSLSKTAVTINRGIPVTLAGGYSDATFSAAGRTTTKLSHLTVTSGKLVVDRITVQ
ncbi:MAG: M4 family metallopeptidase [Geobacteraceae bacterium]|nr:M4 family metallopeptidase [Geobacteraceae bacterium]